MLPEDPERPLSKHAVALVQGGDSKDNLPQVSKSTPGVCGEARATGLTTDPNGLFDLQMATMRPRAHAVVAPPCGGQDGGPGSRAAQEPAGEGVAERGLERSRCHDQALRRLPGGPRGPGTVNSPQF